ncbi:MAG: cupin [Flavobacteriales bacterium]|nr:cupin [Flavobacteriales bacterium]
MKKSKYWIENLKLTPHPEGGYYKEIYRSKKSFQPKGFSGRRDYMTSIYFLLEKGEVSHFHSIKSDELWSYHAGDSLTVFVLHPDGDMKKLIIGPNLEKGEVLQAVVPEGSVFGSKSNGAYSLVGCTVSPGFDFNDFKLFKTSQLIEEFPDFTDTIKEFSKEEY